MSADYRDLCIETLSDSNAHLLDRIADVIADRDSYKLLAKQLLHALHHVTAERDDFRRKYYEQLDRWRQQRAA